ncbi:hypothetical protein Taro_049390, partial [Colocasia esculenta]|nr:hypothetical protein [Colocasia esculenta]
MAAKVTNGCSLLRASAVCAPSSGVRPRRCLHLHPSVLNTRTAGSASLVPRCCFWPSRLFRRCSSYAFVGPFSAPRLVDLVMEELREELKSGKRVRATGGTMLLNNELAEDRLEKQVLQKGMLLEFRKDSERIFLAVAQKPDGKKNWMVYDQNGATSSIKPQQITYIIPGIKDLDHTEIIDFVQKAHDLLDPSILECAWIELLEKNKLVTTEELAEIVYGCREPLESYCAHLLLSKDEVYFTVKESKGFSSVYQPRPIALNEEEDTKKGFPKSPPLLCFLAGSLQEEPPLEDGCEALVQLVFRPFWHLLAIGRLAALSRHFSSSLPHHCTIGAPTML